MLEASDFEQNVTPSRDLHAVCRGVLGQRHRGYVLHDEEQPVVFGNLKVMLSEVLILTPGSQRSDVTRSPR